MAVGSVGAWIAALTGCLLYSEPRFPVGATQEGRRKGAGSPADSSHASEATAEERAVRVVDQVRDLSTPATVVLDFEGITLPGLANPKIGDYDSGNGGGPNYSVVSG